MTATAPIHPDDLLFFTEVSAKMREVARDYKLSLRSVSGLPMPEEGMADRKGDCSHTSDIRLVLRCTVNGEWCEEPRSPESVWETAAHELAHLRHFNHGEAFQTFRLELINALRNTQQDHREKVIDRLVKMQASRDGEAALGNSAAAEAFASAINRMLIDHELSPSDLDYSRATDRDPVIEVKVNLDAYHIEKKKTRVAWQESLARIVARAHLCSFLLQPKTNNIYFVGTNSHATVAEYAYGVLVPAADKMSKCAHHEWREDLREKYGVGNNKSLVGTPTERFGFREAWLDAFIGRIDERFIEARQAAVAAAPEGSSVALVRLDGALVKTRQYIEDKFAGRRRRVSALNFSGRSSNAEGSARGRAAADRMSIGRKGVTGGGSQKLLK